LNGFEENIENFSTQYMISAYVTELHTIKFRYREREDSIKVSLKRRRSINN